MKATTSVMKNTLEGINSVDTTRGKMSELEDNRNNPNKTQRVFKILTEHPYMDNFKWPNIPGSGIPK